MILVIFQVLYNYLWLASLHFHPIKTNISPKDSIKLRKKRHSTKLYQKRKCILVAIFRNYKKEAFTP